MIIHKVIIPGYELPAPISEKEESALFNKLRKRVDRSLTSENPEKAFLGEIYITLEEHKDSGLHPRYCGFYGMKPKDSMRTNPRAYNMGDQPGCERIPIWKGVIGTAVRLYGGKSVYVTSVYALEQADPNAHWECDPNLIGEEVDPALKGAEIVINLPYIYKTGRKKGLMPTRMLLDLDIQRENPFSDRGVGELEKICVPAMQFIFPGPPSYTPIRVTHMSVPEKRRSRVYCPVH